MWGERHTVCLLTKYGKFECAKYYPATDTSRSTITYIDTWNSE